MFVHTLPLFLIDFFKKTFIVYKFKEINIRKTFFNPTTSNSKIMLCDECLKCTAGCFFLNKHWSLNCFSPTRPDTVFLSARSSHQDKYYPSPPAREPGQAHKRDPISSASDEGDTLPTCCPISHALPCASVPYSGSRYRRYQQEDCKYGFGDSGGGNKRSLLRHEWVEKVEKRQSLTISSTRRTWGYQTKAGNKAEVNKREYFPQSVIELWVPATGNAKCILASTRNFKMEIHGRLSVEFK